MLTKRRLYDYRDIDLRELRLIRVGHWLWAQYKNALKAGTVVESVPLLAACETVWEAKRVLRAELQAERSAKWEQSKAAFAR